MRVPWPWRRPDPAPSGPGGTPIHDRLSAEFGRIQSSYSGGLGRHRLTGHDDDTEELPVTAPDPGVDVVADEEVAALMPPAVPEEEQTVAVCGQEES
jgi:hypothetical protein